MEEQKDEVVETVEELNSSVEVGEALAEKKPSKLRIALTALCVVLAVWVVMVGTSVLSTPYPWEPLTPNESIRDYSVLFEPNETLDVLIFGDSEAYSAYSPLDMYRQEGFTSYTCSVGAQLITRSEVVLETVLQRQSPKVVFVETSQLFAECGRVDALKAEAVKIFPVLEYHDRWKSLLSIGGNRKIGKWWGESFKGFRTSDEIVPANDEAIAAHEAMTDDVAPIADVNRQYLKMMVDVSAEKGAQVILVSTPSTWAWNSARHNAAQQIADELGITYLDFNKGEHEIVVDWKAETRDGGDHLNYSGSSRVSSYLASYLSNHFELPDHRGQEGFEKWDSEVARFEEHHPRHHHEK